MGAVPIAVGYGAGGEARQSLGLCVVGGLIFSQAVTLFLTPVFYLYLGAAQSRFSRKKRARNRNLRLSPAIEIASRYKPLRLTARLSHIQRMEAMRCSKTESQRSTLAVGSAVCDGRAAEANRPVIGMMTIVGPVRDRNDRLSDRERRTYEQQQRIARERYMRGSRRYDSATYDLPTAMARNMAIRRLGRLLRSLWPVALVFVSTILTIGLERNR